MHNLCNTEDQRLMEQLKKYISSGHTLARPYQYRSLYIRTDWSRYGMGAVLFQADVLTETINSEAQEKDGGKCEFDKSLEGMRLRPISLILRSTVSTLENSRHRFVGYEATVRWSIGKFNIYFLGIRVHDTIRLQWTAKDL